MPKKKPKPKGDEPMRGWLLGWKEIANYMGCSIKTAREYNVKYRLPIQNLPGMKYKKLGAVPSDLDDWLRKQQK